MLDGLEVVNAGGIHGAATEDDVVVVRLAGRDVVGTSAADRYGRHAVLTFCVRLTQEARSLATPHSNVPTLRRARIE